jgi:6-phosphogluconate dehydrogenase
MVECSEFYDVIFLRVNEEFLFMPQGNFLCDIGFIGLGVMGKNLVLNLADNGYSIAAFDLSNEKIDAVVQQDSSEQQSITGKDRNTPRVYGCSSVSDLLSKLQAPYSIVLSIPAGKPVDLVCQSLIEAGLPKDSIVIDTGNSLWVDTVAREKKYQDNFTLFSSAISGGEVGARFGPALMPSGNAKAWRRIEPIWQAISAKVDSATGKPLERTKPGDVIEEGEACTTYIGPAGAGHYVKMVHNGIEYADMQIICEAYHALSTGIGMNANDIADVFEEWNKGPLDSYLLEITIDVLRHKELETGQPIVELILDKAGQKGTGLWTAISSLELGCPAPTIAEAVFARSISSFKSVRVDASKKLKGPALAQFSHIEKELFISQLHDAMYCAKMCAYAQGFQLMKLAGKEHGWDFDFASIAKIWRAGCIIRAAFLQSITDAFTRDNHLDNLLLDEFFIEELNQRQMNWRKALSTTALIGIPTGALSSSLAYFDALRTETLPANLLQAQRDYFGAHTFSRVDKPIDEAYHVEWATKERHLIKL